MSPRLLARQPRYQQQNVLALILLRLRRYINHLLTYLLTCRRLSFVNGDDELHWSTFVVHCLSWFLSALTMQCAICACYSILTRASTELHCDAAIIGVCSACTCTPSARQILGAEFMGLSCKCTPQGRGCTHSGGGVAFLLGGGGCSV